MTAILAIDLGGTRMRVGRADGAELPDLIEDAPAPQDLADFTSRVRRLLTEHGATRLGIGVPGLTRGTVCSWIPNLGYLDGLDLAASFPGIEIGLGNDAQLALLAEATAGAANGLGDAILLSIGTGIGSAVLSGGRIVRGSRGGACSFGWASADPADRGDPRQGWLERHASGRALDAAAEGLGLRNGVALITAAQAGSEAALGALRRPMHLLGTALAGAVGLLDPELIIVTGGVATAMDLLTPMILAGLRPQLPAHLQGIGIRAGAFGPRAGLIGAGIAGRRGGNWGTIDG